MIRPMTEAADPALIGRRVAGKFVVEQLLGGGSMGAIYRARDESLERIVALKVMHPSVAVDPSFVTRFHREARAASRLDHPNSMRVIEFGEEPDGLLYIAMEYLEGRDLYKVIHEDWPLSDARIADIMMKALSAIAVAHEMGVIHRDLKPENIMILNRKDDEGNDVVKVCDFGIAKITEKDDDAGADAAPKTAGAKVTTAGLVVGTPEYMSPEQARGEKLDARSDLYSMGIILYQLLTGRTPFLADTALAVVLKHITETPEPPRTIYPDVHAGLETVCMRALAKPKEERWQSAREMRAGVKAAIGGRPLPIGESAVTAVDPLSDSRALGAIGPGAFDETKSGGAGSGRPSARVSTHGPEALGSSAPALGMSVGTSKATPLVAALTASEEKRSRAPVFVAGAIGLLVLGGVGVVLAQKGEEPSGDANVPATSIVPPTASTTSTKREAKSPTTATSTPASPAPASSHASDAKAAKLPPLPVPKAAPEPKTTPTSTQTAAAREHAQEPLSAPAPAPTPEPHSTVSPPPKPEPAPAPPPAPAFNPATCRATLGAPRSTSGFSAKDLTLRGTDAAWSSCAKSAIKERPAAPLGAAVRIRFDDNRGFRGATCSGCTPALAQCVASATAKTASVNFKSGDVTGDPEFEVPVTFTCD